MTRVTSTHELVLKRPPQGSLRFAHPWIYRNQIKDVSSGAEPGCVVRVLTESGKFMGQAYWNPKSEITARLLTRSEDAVDRAWIRTRMENALAFRLRELESSVDGYRLISSEADGLPGLIVDRYGPVCVVQFLTLGMERMRKEVLEALREACPGAGIYERSDASVRKLEGLPDQVGWIDKNCADTVHIHEGGLEIEIRFEEGHKTGWYLDQRDNRVGLKRWVVAGGKALDVFCYQGGFGLHLAKAGMSVTAVDSQADVLGRAAFHRQHNGIGEDRLNFVQANAFDELKRLERSGATYDLIVLDPPSFGKQKNALAGALSGYREIVHRSFKMLSPEGRLAVFSCAYHVDDNLLMQASLAAAQDARRPVRLLHFFRQGADHPILPFVPETYYLKGFLFGVYRA